jgi:hypothetical protein
VIESAESDAVTAFIRMRQPEVLAEAIRQLSSCTREDLPAVAHAVAGNVGSYQLVEAHHEISGLREVLADPESSESDVEASWSRAVSALRMAQSGLPHE